MARRIIRPNPDEGKFTLDELDMRYVTVRWDPHVELPVVTLGEGISVYEAYSWLQVVANEMWSRVEHQGVVVDDE